MIKCVYTKWNIHFLPITFPDIFSHAGKVAGFTFYKTIRMHETVMLALSFLHCSVQWHNQYKACGSVIRCIAYVIKA